MNEQNFIRKNKKHWEQFEDFLHHSRETDPDRLSELYIHVIDDLSYARTHYRNSNLVRYLNQLAVKAHKQIYGTRRESMSRILSLYRQEIPKLFLKYRRFFLFAFCVFAISVGLGWISNTLDPSFVRTVLGDMYVNQTLENIEAGDPLAVYSSGESAEMFAWIATNNINVAFMCYILGFAGGLPSALILLMNGVMVGAFLHFFFTQGLGWLSFSTIFLHGATELAAIILAGGCGLLIGSKVLFPGTYPRGHSIVDGARTSLKMIFGVLPFFLLAAFIESYITRHYLEMSGIARLLLILGTFGVMCWYVFIYPLTLKNDESTNNRIRQAT